jgi:4-hydroxy-3-polyprenylbenzoate decarboxylase
LAFSDIRQFIKALEDTGDLVRVARKVDWDLEIGAILRRLYETEGPAPLFESIQDYPDSRVLGGPLGTYRRLAVAMGLEPSSSYSAILQEYEDRLENRIMPTVVRSGPCKENILLGDEVDIYRFPIPMLHDGDGGRYLTCHFIAAKDPDSNWINWGLYRLMIHNHRHLGGLVLPYGDMGSIFYQKYVPKNQPMPVAIVIGADPLCYATAMIPLPAGVSEVEFAGALRLEPVELVKCETSDILVPASAEIVLEAELLPNVTVLEGPFGEYTGYRTSPRMPRSVYRLKAITHRHNPIFTTTCNGLPTDDHLVLALGMAAQLKKVLREHKIPVTEVYLPTDTVFHMVIVGVKPSYSNVATQIGNLVAGVSRGFQPYVMVVDSDVDVTNWKEVLHALVTKCHPVRGINIIDKEVGIPLLPFLSPEERKWGRGARVVFDCTWPLDWPRGTAVPPKVAFNSDETYPPEVRENVLARWTEYGFKEA